MSQNFAQKREQRTGEDAGVTPEAHQANATDTKPAGARSQSYYLQDACLYSLALNGIKCSRNALVQGLPVEDQCSLEGLARGILQQGACVGQVAALNELAQQAFPCIVVMQADSEAVAAVVEAYDERSQQYQIRYFGEGVAAAKQSCSMAELQANAELNVLSIVLRESRHVAGANTGDSDQKHFSNWLGRELKSLASVYRDVLMATLVINFFALASPLFVMNVYDRVVPNQAVETLWVLASGLMIVIVFELVIKLLRHSFLEQAGKRLDLVLSSKMFSRVLNIRMDVFPDSVGSLASQLKEFDAIKQFFTAATITALTDVPFAIVFILVIYVIGGGIVWVPLCAALAMVVYGLVVHFPIKKLVSQMQAAAADKNSVLVESLQGIETLKSLNAEGRQQGFWENALIRFSALGIKAKHLSDSVSIVATALMQISTMLVIIVGVYLINQQAMSLGALIACVLLSSRALAPMMQVANLMTQYQQARSALKAIDDLSTRPAERAAEQSYLSLGGPVNELEARELSFAYGSGPEVLKSLSLSLKAGDKVGIIGKIGSGKSSLMRLLLGFGQANSGQLLINGFEIKHLDLSEVRAAIGYVPQDIVLFKGTLRDNIVMKSPLASQDAILDAVQLAGLSEFVRAHEMGLDMPIGENGQGLSGGQKQCVAIARALINDPGLLLFDELTSSMDNQSEQEIIGNIRRYAEDKILLLSTHRASLLSLVDRIIVLDEGRIIADGPKATVLDALKRGLIQPGSQFNAVKNSVVTGADK